MHILYFSRDYTPHDHRFLEALARTDHQIFYLRLEKGPHPLEDRPLPAGVTQIPWAGGRGQAHLSDGPRLLASLRKVIKAHQPDLIHAGPIQTAGLLTALTGFHPFVAASWGYDLLLDADRSSRWRWATRYTLQRADAFVGDCETIRQRARVFGMDPDRIVIFPWGIDLQRFTPRRGETAAPSPDDAIRSRLGWDDHFVLLSTRAWEPMYGTLDLAKAFVQASKSHPELRLILLGAGSQAQELRQVFLRGGVLDRIHFGGQASQEKLPRYFQAADLYVSASHSDGTSISLLEALASGLPALVSDIPGNLEWIAPGVHGWAFPVGDIEALAAAIGQAAEARDNLTQMKRAARKLAEERANWERNFPRLLEAYDIALKAG